MSIGLLAAYHRRVNDFVLQARSFVDRSFPSTVAAFLGGSTPAGAAGPTSDLDIVVILDKQWDNVAFIETSTYEGRLVEAFVYGPAGLDWWLRHDRTSRRPVIDQLIGRGVVLVDTPRARELQDMSRRILASGPTPLTGDEHNTALYALSALLDDLRDALGHGAATEYVLAAATWRAAAELTLLAQRQWIGTGKWLVRELRGIADPHGLLAWAADPARSAADLIPIIDAVLHDHGGYLQTGMLRGSRPAGL